MKKVFVLLFAVGIVLAFGVAYAAEKTAEPKDTFLNYIDPSYAETAAVMAHMEEGITGEAAGGIRAEGDTFLNYIDPSRMDVNPGVRVKSGPLEKVAGKDTLLDDIAPANVKDWGGGD